MPLTLMKELHCCKSWKTNGIMRSQGVALELFSFQLQRAQRRMYYRFK